MTPICPQCRNRGYKVTKINGYDTAAGYCSCGYGVKLYQRDWKQKMLDAHIYEEYHPLELGHLIPQEYPEHVRFIKQITEYINNLSVHALTGKSLLISGGTGTGNTLAGVLILKEALRKMRNAFYISWPELLQCYIQDQDEEKKLQRDKTNDVSFLVIDQLGSDSIKKESKHPTTVLEEVLRYRITRLKPTIFITELSYMEVALRFDIVEDFKDKLEIIEVRGKNWRKRKTKEGEM